MNKQLSHRVQSIKPSPTLAITARAKALRAAGQDIIGLGAGEPDFDTPDHIKQAAIAAINDGFTKYTEVDGTPELKTAVIRKLQRDNQLSYEPSQILVSCGGKHSFFNLTQALLNSGDEVIIPAPYWVSYPDMVLLAEGKPVIVEAGIEAGFKITPEQLAAAITAKTRLVVINSPSNPTGVTYSHAELKALGAVLEAHPGIIVASDDIYEPILWNDEPFANILTLCPSLIERGVVLNGVSKAYSMTGWRIGYAGGPEWLIKAMKKIQSQSTSNPTSISQVAAQAALDGDQSCIRTMVTAFKERHDYVIKRLNDIRGLTCLPSQGAFYSFLNSTQAISNLGLADDVAFCEHLITQAGVALVPGSAFGAPGYARLSFATSLETLSEALDRIEQACT
ncbi:MAG: pyridoxal phosphate-dependent aminotransferase [Gammaproteobacteria bacterium]|nr:pyridoxal phosphate-dependent aminotransferase [Gammaproteobacteria bacterium]MCF6363511.1 pyridoxal phosphate-dependent aminotransferase [Gammaproteobacteria bacterium]